MTAKSVEWFQGKIAGYPESADHKGDILDFVNELNLLPRETRQSVVERLRFDTMFELLVKWNNPVFAEPFYDLVVLVFDVMKGSEVIDIYGSLLREFIGHVNDKFQDLVFNVLDRTLDEGNLETLLNQEQLLLEAARVLVDRELDTATPCLKFLTNLAQQVPQGTRIVFMGPIGDLLREYTERDKTFFFRVYEIVTKVACSSPEGLIALQATPMLQILHDSLLGPDAHVDQLGFANTIQVYGALSKAPHCFQFLKDTGVVPKLQERVLEYGPGTMEDKIMPTIYEFFGDVFERNPGAMMIDVPDVVPAVLKHVLIPIDRISTTLSGYSMLSKVASTAQGKLYLHSMQRQFTPVLEQNASFMQSGLASAKQASIDFTEALIFTKSSDQSPDLLQVTEDWFKKSMGSAKVVWDAANEPYADTSVTAVQLLAVLSTLPWGRRHIIATPGLLEWLLNRQAACGVHASTGSGADPEFLRAKYAAVKNLLELASNEDLGLPENMKDKMATFVGQGPLYMQAEYQVAMEGGQD